MNTNNTGILLLGGFVAMGLAWVFAKVERRRRVGESTSDWPAAQPVEAAGEPSRPGPGAAISEEQMAAQMPPSTSQANLPLDYFALVFALTLPFWLLGGRALPIPVKLPTSALSLITPMLAAVILTYRRHRWAGIRDLFKKVFDFKKIRRKIWYLPILFLSPLIMLVSYGVMRITARPLPAAPQVPWLSAPLFLVVFFIAGIGEELGWMGYAFDPMQNRWGALKASIILGVIWALFHVIPDLQNGQTASWILWQRLGTVALRVLIVWIYNNTGKSVFSAILFHAMVNLGWALFPNYGSHYDPLITSLITFVVTGMVLLGWEAGTLARLRFIRWGTLGNKQI